MTKSISVRDVAAAAGVSIASVSRVLNRSGYVSADARERVERAVRETGYAPNFSAKHLRTGRSKAVGLLVSNMANPFLAAFFASAERHLHAAGFSLLVSSTYQDPNREQELLTLFESRRLEGVIAFPALEGVPRARNPFARCKLPLVVVDRDIDCGGDVVFQDHRAGVHQSVNYLCALGHRRIALFGPSMDIRPGREKYRGYCDALAERGIRKDDRLVCMLRSAVDSPEEQMQRMLQLEEPPTALVALGTRILSGALRTARRSGRHIPHDLSVIAIGTENAFALVDPPLTTLRFNIDQAAQGAARLMLERLGDVDRPRRTLNVQLDLVLGESCVPPARSA